MPRCLARNNVSQIIQFREDITPFLLTGNRSLEVGDTNLSYAIDILYLIIGPMFASAGNSSNNFIVLFRLHMLHLGGPRKGRQISKRRRPNKLSYWYRQGGT